MNKLKAFLRASKITDKHNQLSLTNLGVAVVLYKIATASTLEWSTASALLLTLLSYNFKRTVENKADQDEKTAGLKLSDIEAKVQELNKAFNLKNLMR